MEETLSLKKLQKQKHFFEDLVRQKFIFAQSFEIYGGVKGLYDFGPVGCAVKNNMQARWKDHFILEDDMLELHCSCLTPYVVLKNSGHVDRFTDMMCKDSKTKEPYRADHLLEDFCSKKLKDPKLSEEKRKEFELLKNTADDLSIEEMKEAFAKYSIKAPLTQNDLTDPVPFNLMFATQIGPWSDAKGFLRPETAQSIITNFKKLLTFNNGKLPVVGANIGLGFRNEISPKNSILRVREFEMGEIEHFYDPLDKTHAKFNTVRDVKIPFWSAENQMKLAGVQVLTVGEAFDSGLICNEILAYYAARIFLYMEDIGIDVKNGIRFRQHKAKEMAHYADDCWDCELLTSYGWIECVGLADRAAFDLQAHSKGTNKPILAARRLDKPRKEERIKIILNKGPLGKTYKQEAKIIFSHIDGLDIEGKKAFKDIIENDKEYVIKSGEKEYKLNKEHVKKFKVSTVNVIEEKFTPAIIEPAFGFGRVLYALLEHNFHMRDKVRTFFHFKPDMAPIKCSILPLMSKPKLLSFVDDLVKEFKKKRVSVKVDSTGQTIGKRYARTDEIGIPFGITIDFDTVDKQLVTLRDSLSMKQVQIGLDEIVGVVQNLARCDITWSDVLEKYPLFEATDTPQE